MNVYLFHGFQKEREDNTAPDRETDSSPLTTEMTQALLPGIQKLIGSLDYILFGPDFRDREYSYWIGTHFKCCHLTEDTPLLSQPGAEKDVLKKVNALIGKENVMIIGHQPFLGAVLRCMLPESAEIGEPAWDFACMAKVHFKGFILPQQGRFEWFHTADELRGLNA